MIFDLHADQYGTSYNCLHCGYAEYSSMGGTSVMNPGQPQRRKQERVKIVFKKSNKKPKPVSEKVTREILSKLIGDDDNDEVEYVFDNMAD